MKTKRKDDKIDSISKCIDNEFLTSALRTSDELDLNECLHNFNQQSGAPFKRPDQSNLFDSDMEEIASWDIDASNQIVVSPQSLGTLYKDDWESLLDDFPWQEQICGNKIGCDNEKITLEHIFSDQNTISFEKNISTSQVSNSQDIEVKVEVLDLSKNEWYKNDWKNCNASQCSDIENLDPKVFTSKDDVDNYFNKFDEILLSSNKGFTFNTITEKVPSVRIQCNDVKLEKDVEKTSVNTFSNVNTQAQEVSQKTTSDRENHSHQKVFSVKSKSNNSTSKRDKTTEYYYLLERKAIRMMRRYYKEAFEQFAQKYKYKQYLKKLIRAVADKYFLEYVDHEFKNFPQTVNFFGAQSLATSLQTIILCDRYKKNEPVTEGLNFDDIRVLLNKYNTKLMKEFLGKPIHAFLFSHYYRTNSIKDAQEQRHVDSSRLMTQMSKIYGMWRDNLAVSIPTAYECEVY